MYIQTILGFAEIDTWDGKVIPDATQHADVQRLAASGGRVVILRSRQAVTLECMTAHLPTNIGKRERVIEIYHTPEWDYAYRVYLLRWELAHILGEIALHCIGYRNFKSEMQRIRGDEDPQTRLANGIWKEAYINVDDK